MVIERARLSIRPGEEPAFEAEFGQVVGLFRRAKGCSDVWIERVVEEPSTYVLVVHWNELEDHTVHFRASEDFLEWRRRAGPYFAQPPVVEHLRRV